jgi:hypothetical protein
MKLGRYGSEINFKLKERELSKKEFIDLPG